MLKYGKNKKIKNVQHSVSHRIKIPEHSDKWESVKLEIEKTDKKIDEEVYKLYGLTEEEIETVENS